MKSVPINHLHSPSLWGCVTLTWPQFHLFLVLEVFFWQYWISFNTGIHLSINIAKSLLLWVGKRTSTHPHSLLYSEGMEVKTQTVCSYHYIIHEIMFLIYIYNMIPPRTLQRSGSIETGLRALVKRSIAQGSSNTSLESCTRNSTSPPELCGAWKRS